MKNKNNAVRALTEGAVMIALATVLSLLKIIQLPYGGSVTVASLLPIAVISYRHGAPWGLLTALVHGAVQLLLDISMVFSYFTTWQSLVAVFLLDYIVAFAVAGLAGIFRKSVKNQALALCLGGLMACLLRYACHVIGGATVWAGLSIPSEAAMIYSLSYNATYMLPETIILLVVTAYIGVNINFESKMPTRMRHPNLPSRLGWMAPAAGLIAVAATIADTVLIFSKLQDAESGEFAITNLASVNWTLVIAITAVGVLTTASLLAIRGVLYKKSIT